MIWIIRGWINAIRKANSRSEPWGLRDDDEDDR